MLFSSSQQLRIDRLSQNNIFLLDVIKKTFDYFIKICGTTKNIYTVKISHSGYNKGKLYCDCPDGKKFHNQLVFCKHCCFVVVKIIKNLNIKHNLMEKICKLLVFDDNQLNLIIDELDKFNIENHSQLIDNNLITKFNNYNGPIFDTKQYNNDDLCMICFDEYGLTSVNICPTCSKIFHKKCIMIWFNNTINKSCPHCRSTIWIQFESKNDYNNLA